MPSYESVAQHIQRLTRDRPRLALGAVAASAATFGSVASIAAAGIGPAAGLSTVSYTTPVVLTADITHASSPLAAAAAGQFGPSASASWRTPAPAAASDIVRIAAGAQLSVQPQVTSTRPASATTSRPTTTGGPHSATASPVSTPQAPPAPAASAAPAAAPAQPQPAPQPFQFYDSVTPSAIPASSQAVAVYADGPYAASPSQVGKRGLVLWIDVNGSDPHADVLDVEPTDATPAQAAVWVQQKLDASPNSTAIIYTMRSEWAAVQQAVSQLPWWMPSHTKYWIADPTGVPHIVPGSQATQWYWGQNYDISTAAPGF